MNANRLPGIGPSDSNKPIDRQAQRQEAQRIEKVGEVDPDEQARQRRFQQIMQSNAEDEEVDAAESSALPTPFDLSSARSSDSGFDDMEEIPNSSYSQPPSLDSSTQGSMSDEGLPQSGQFWKQADLPDQPIRKPKMQEKTAKKPAAAAGQKKGKEELSILGPPDKLKNAPARDKAFGKAKKNAEETPTARYWHADQETRGSAAQASGSAKKRGAKEVEPTDEDTSTEETLAPKSQMRDFAPVLKKAKEQGSDKQGHGEHKGKETVQIMSPSLPELPANVQPAALSATQAAMPYLRQEMLPIFFQMVGTIMVMSAPPGISRTEFILNNPAFANSKFYGASIELIKYSTAPDSYNIRLSGSNEAVAAFQQNIPGLMAAFQTGHFSFRVARIDADYSAERPVLRRKESPDEREGRGSQHGKK